MKRPFENLKCPKCQSEEYLIVTGRRENKRWFFKGEWRCTEKIQYTDAVFYCSRCNHVGEAFDGFKEVGLEPFKQTTSLPPSDPAGEKI